MRHVIRVGTVLFLFFCLAGCRPFGSNLEIGSGTSRSETRAVDTFQRLDVAAAIRATVRIGEPTSVTVTADDNLLDNVVTEVQGEQLALRMSGSTTSRIPVQVDIVAPSLTAIHAGSASSVVADGLAGSALKLEADSAGWIEATGSAPSLDLRVGSAGQLRLHDLATGNATVTIDSAGHAWLRATDAVHGSVDSGGVLTLLGEPASVDVSTDFSGVVERG